MFETDRGLVQQLGRHREVDPGSVEIGVAEPCGERRQQPLHVGALSVPGFQPVNGRCMSKRMKARRAPSIVPVMPDPGRLERLDECTVERYSSTNGVPSRLARKVEAMPFGKGRSLRLAA